jgi:PPP family 3-phenylpropionic acid transporter
LPQQPAYCVGLAWSADVLSFALVEPLHGISFALLHLACMRLITRLVPGDLAGTGQAIYGTGIGAATVALTFLSGDL